MKSLADMIAEIDAIGDPKEHDRRMNELTTQMLGTRSPARAAVTDVIPAPAMQKPAPFDIESYYSHIKQHESGGDPNAKNPTSSAQGSYQFLRGTWEQVAKQHPELRLNNRTDPAQNELAIRAFTDDNARTLRMHGIPINGGSLYAAHFLGAGGANQVLRNPDSAKMVDVVGPGVINANGFLTPMTVGDFKRWAAKAGGDGVTPLDTSMQPTVKNASEQQQLIEEADLGDRILTPNRMESFSDEDLAAIIQNPSASTVNPGAQEEIATRKSIDQGGLLSFQDATADLLRDAGNVVGGAAELPTSGPIGLAGLLAKGAELATGADLHADDILRASGDIRSDVRSAVGISEPRNVTESLAGILPAIIPIPGTSNPVSTIGSIAEVLTPLVIGSGPGRILANFATAAVVDQGLRELTDTAQSKYRTVFDMAGLTNPATDSQWPETAKWIGLTMGAMAGAGIITPMAVKMIRESTVFKDHPAIDIRDIDMYGPDNLKTLERAGDRLKTFFLDEKQVLQDLYKRSGAPDYFEVAQRIDQDSQMTALMRVNEADKTGLLVTKDGTYHVDITPHQLVQENAKLPPALQADVDMYLKYKQYSDLLKQRIAIGKQVADDPRAKLANVNRNLYELEQRTPVVKEFSAAYQHITAAVRNFLGQGENAMFTPQELIKHNRELPNFVPLETLHVDPKNGLGKRIADVLTTKDQKDLDNWYRQHPEDMAEQVDNRPNAIALLHDYARNALKSRMEHSVRGAVIRGTLNSPNGNETMRIATTAEREMYKDRIIRSWERGEKKYYITSKLQANLLRFDPYIARFPITFFIKRALEQFATGPATIVSGAFAPKLMLRDAIGGFISKDVGMKGPGGPIAIGGAVGRNIWAKTQLAIIDVMQSNMHIPFIDDAGKKQLAQQMSSSYMSGLHHLANIEGGTDASILHGSIQGRGVLQEVMKSVDAVGGQIPGARFLGRNASTLLHGLNNLFTAIAEGPRTSTFERNVKAGASPAAASKFARNLTGDTMRSGRVYSPNKKMIEADAQNKGLNVAVDKLGMPVEFLREATPYFNPMVQSLRKMGKSFVDDPIGTNLRVWSMMGLPAMISIGWNEMLGPDYNKHAFENRTSRDIATNMYFGMPGAGPEHGIQWPMPLEYTPWHSMFTTGLYGMIHGDDTGAVLGAMMHIAGVSLENNTMVGYPQIATLGLAAMGVTAPQTINPLPWKDEVYTVDEDNIGVLPQNVEQMARALFANVGTTMIASIDAMHEGGPGAFFEEMGHQMLSRTPILNAITTTPVSNFTPFSDMKQTKIDALKNFLEIYEDQVTKAELLRKTTMPSVKGLVPNTDLMTRYRLSPNPKVPTSNPLILKYGKLIKSVLDSNTIGMTGLMSRDSMFRKQVKSLRAYTAGRKDAYREWQKSVIGKDQEYRDAITKLGKREDAPNKKAYDTAVRGINNTVGEAAKAERIYNSMHLDMTKRGDVMKLIGALETQRVEMIKEQLKLIGVLEAKMSELLIQSGEAPPGFKFNIEKHLGNLEPTGLN